MTEDQTENTSTRPTPSNPALLGWRSVTVKMMIGTALLLVPTLLASVWFSMAEHVKLEEEQVSEDVSQVAFAIEQSFEVIPRGSATAHQAQLQRAVGALALVDSVRVVNINGRISFSLDPEEGGEQFNRLDREPCSGCHMNELDPSDGSAVFDMPDGTAVYHQMTRIENNPICQQCHMEEYNDLGVLLVSFDMSDVRAEMSHYRRSAGMTIVLAVVVVMCGIALLFHLLIRRPLHRIRSQMGRVEQGDFELGSPVTSQDELGQLYATFAGMTKQLAENRRQLQQRVTEGSKKVTALTKKLRTIDADLVKLERLSAIGALSAQVGHEVRTPLNALSMNLQLLQRQLRRHGDVEPEIIELTDNSSAEIERIAQVLNRFMERARLPTVKFVTESVQTLVRGVFTLLNLDAEEKGVSLNLTGATDIPPLRLPGDYLRQVLINLLSNGIRACRDGGRIQVEATLRDSRLLILTVADDGEGIPADELDRIFRPFYTTHEEGTGLGLAVVRQILQRVQGSISVESTEGQGTTFTIEVPTNSSIEAGDE